MKDCASEFERISANYALKRVEKHVSRTQRLFVFAEVFKTIQRTEAEFATVLNANGLSLPQNFAPLSTMELGYPSKTILSTLFAWKQAAVDELKNVCTLNYHFSCRIMTLASLLQRPRCVLTQIKCREIVLYILLALVPLTLSVACALRKRLSLVGSSGHVSETVDSTKGLCRYLSPNSSKPFTDKVVEILENLKAALEEKAR